MRTPKRGDGRCESLVRPGEGGFRALPLKNSKGRRSFPLQKAGASPSGEIQVVPRFYNRPESVWTRGVFCEVS